MIRVFGKLAALSAVALGVGAAFGVTTSATAPAEPATVGALNSSRTQDTALSSEGRAVADWNAIAQNALVSVGKKCPGEAAVHLSIVHATICDVVVAMEGGYRPSAITPAVPPNTSLDRVRVLDPVLRSALDRGVNRSPTFVRLVAYLQHSDLIVYLVQGTCPGRHVAGCLVSVTQQGGSRYIRINVVLVRRAETTGLKRSPVQLIGLIGHELQHAVEIADEPSVVDGPSLGRMHKRKGSHVNLDGCGYETDAALQAGEAVLRELTQHNSSALKCCQAIGAHQVTPHSQKLGQSRAITFMNEYVSLRAGLLAWIATLSTLAQQQDIFADSESSESRIPFS